MNERDIFTSALQIEDAQQRAAFLDEACGGDAALRQRIAALLEVHRRAGGILDEPLAAPTGAVTVNLVSEGPGTQIGPYKLLQQIGEGGMGVVYMAEQSEPVRRKVALKIIKPGMDSQLVVARFEAERQALALMEHPNIARVLDAGTTDSGRPFFVMDLVRGVAITEYCDQNNLATAERLELFAQVCAAVQHAHTKGVIHRDLKPMNVLVTLHDGVPVVKVIDFGIAKAVNQELTERTLFTQFGQMIGTPLYMSPEQAEMSGLDVDTRSDIYSLGVLLYELLTGTTPFDRQKLQSAAYDEIRRVIREEEPPRPSAKLSTLGQALTAVSAHRRTDPKRLTQLVRGDLDWIVMKSLDKDRTRRYQTASELAADVGRHLNNEPVAAGPPTAAYRLRKFCRKHRAAVASGSAIAVSLVLGLLLVLKLYMRAEDERASAELARAAESRRAGELRVALDERDAALGEKTQALATKDAALADKAVALRRSEALRLTAQSTIALPEDPGLALLLAIEAAKQGPRLGTLNNALLAALTTCREQRTLSVRGSSPDGGSDYARLAVLAATYSPDGTRVLTVAGGSYDRKVTLNTQTDLFGSFQGQETLNSRFSQELGVAQVWDVASGRVLVTIEAPPDQRFRMVRFSPDGRRLVATLANSTLVRFAGGETHLYTDRVARLYDATTGAALAILRGHTGAVVAARFSPDSRRVVTASLDGTARVWDAATGEQRFVIEASRAGNLEDARFTPDGRRIVTLCPASYHNKKYVDDPSQDEKRDRSRWKIDPPAGRREAVTDLKLGEWGKSSTVFAARAAVAKATNPDSPLELPGLRVWDAENGISDEAWLEAKGQATGQQAGGVGTFCFSEDGTRMAIGRENGAFAVLSLAEEKGWSLNYADHNSPVVGLAFGGGDRRLLITFRDGSLALHDAENSKRLGFWPNTSGVRTALAGPDGDRVIVTGDTRQHELAARIAGGTVSILDAEGKRGPVVLKGHTNRVGALSVSPSGEELLTASADGTARIWNLAETVDYGRTFKAPGPVQSALISPSGEYLAVAHAGPGLLATVYSTRTGQRASVIDETRAKPGESPYAQRALGPLRQLEFSPAADRVLTLSANYHLRIISADASLVELNSMATEDWPVAEQLHTAQVRVWDAATGRELFALHGQTLDVRWAGFSPDGKRILTLSAPYEKQYCAYPPNDQLFARITVNAPDRRTPLVHIWDAADGKLLYAVRDLTNPQSEWGSISWSADGGSFAATKLIGWLDLSAKKWFLLPGVSSRALPLFSPGGRYLLLRASDETQLVRMDSVRQSRGAHDKIELLTFPASAGEPEKVQLWGESQRAEKIKLVGYSGPFKQAAFSPDGRYLATATEDDAAQIWETASGKLLHVLQGHVREISHASFSPDGRWLATASNDHTARMWDVASGRETLTYRGHQANVHTAVFSPDGQNVLTASVDGTARLWPVDPLPLAIARKPRDLTPAERGQFEIGGSSK